MGGERGKIINSPPAKEELEVVCPVTTPPLAPPCQEGNECKPLRGHFNLMKTNTKKIKVRWDPKEFPIEIIRKKRILEHFRPRELKRYHRWAFFDF